MTSIYCGLCDQEFNFAGVTECPQGWLNRHIEHHNRRLKTADEDIEILKEHRKLDTLMKYKQAIPDTIRGFSE